MIGEACSIKLGKESVVGMSFGLRRECLNWRGFGGDFFRRGKLMIDAYVRDLLPILLRSVFGHFARISNYS